jgi:hypothetical protein
LAAAGDELREQPRPEVVPQIDAAATQSAGPIRIAHEDGTFMGLIVALTSDK